MPILDLDSQVRAEKIPEVVPYLFASANLGRAYFPGRGILYSLLVHEIVFFALIFVPRPPHLTDWARPIERTTKIDPGEPRKVFYLPILGGGSEGVGLQAKNPSAEQKETSGASSPRTRGMTYPGRQLILSDPPNPDNRIQTVLQPTLRKPPPLKLPVFLPNLVLIANSGPALLLSPADPLMKPPALPAPAAPPLVPSVVQPSGRKAVELMLPPVTPSQPIPKDMPKLVLPESISQNVPIAAPGPPEPAPAAEQAQRITGNPVPQRDIPLPEPSQKLVEQKTSNASGLELSPVPMRGNDARTLLALTPTPAPHDRPFEVPPGEARGRFAISPEPDLAVPDAEPGTKTGAASQVPGLGTNTADQTGNAVSTTSGGTGAGNGTAKDKASASGSGGAGTAAGSRGGSTPGSGTGSGSGTGIGSGAGKGSGTGAGSSSGPGRTPFAGITIVGGATETGIAVNSASPPRARRPLQTSYGVTIVSTEASGGGLPSYGVFGGAQVYTVYLDMRQTEADPTPSWTLEYAVVQDPAAQASAFEGPSTTQQGLVLPFPTVREPPVFPVELVRKYLRRLVIVYAIISTEGKMGQLSVMDSPDPLLKEPVLASLAKWVFRPARLNNQPVAAKVLIGIPLWLSE